MKRTLAAIALLGLTACGHTEVHALLLRPQQASAARDPDLYFEGRGPARAVYELAIVQVIGFGADANPEDIASSLVARGRELGCDALVRVRVDQGTTRAHGVGVCVRYAGPAVPPPRSPAATPPPAASSGVSL